MNPAEFADFDDHEKVVFLSDEATGLAGIIAVHSTALGPAMGGCRMANYPDADAALKDALRLSRGMSYKNALAGLPAGGGKAVLYRVGAKASRQAVFEAFASAVDELGGTYVTAEDVGTSLADMEFMARRTRFVSGLPVRAGTAGGDPSPWTALGVYLSIEAAAERPLKGARVAVQGLGAVGFKVCEMLRRAGADLVVADVDRDRVGLALRDLDAEAVSVDRIHSVPADVFSPNALGGILNAETIPALGAPIVCGGANNQLATSEDGHRLLARGITYAPDYVVNAGGIINVVAEYLGEPAASVEPRVRLIGDRVRRILESAKRDSLAPHEIADQIGRNALGRSTT